ncbi:MAG TPA: helix-turn-helix transcriptional regulator [Enhygromyxa sp.]|nr:helix-turn-helix transcriptional regulator [Enhygromyxa sp.]
MRVDTGRLRVVETIERSDASPRRKRRPAAAEPQVSEVEPEQRTPGAYIHHQRKRKGMSLDQLAVLTKIPRAQLELLEADRYEELPGMVFAKGFLRCCARALELDPDTVLGLLYERERERLRARRRESSVTVGVQPAPRKPSRGSSAQLWIAKWLSQWISRLPSARILMWLVVALLVALVVLIAFTLASAQAETMIRS